MRDLDCWAVPTQRVELQQHWVLGNSLSFGITEFYLGFGGLLRQGRDRIFCASG